MYQTMEELTGSKALRIALKSRSVWLGLDKLRVNYTWNQPVHGSLEKVAARGLSRKCTNNPPTLHNVLFISLYALHQRPGTYTASRVCGAYLIGSLRGLTSSVFMAY